MARDDVAGCLCLVLAAALLAAIPVAANAQRAFSYHSPFHPEECEHALHFAPQHADSRRARLILSEGLLCRGLQDDPAALDAAIAHLRTIAAEEPANFFVQLDLADALRKRFPLSDAAETQLRSVRALLDRSDVGAARAELTTYIDENLAAVIEYRARLLPLLEHSRAAFTAGTLPAAEVRDLISLLSLTGSDGLSQANQIRLQQSDGALTRDHTSTVPVSSPRRERGKPK